MCDIFKRYAKMLFSRLHSAYILNTSALLHSASVFPAVWVSQFRQRNITLPWKAMYICVFCLNWSCLWKNHTLTDKHPFVQQFQYLENVLSFLYFCRCVIFTCVDTGSSVVLEVTAFRDHLRFILNFHTKCIFNHPFLLQTLWWRRKRKRNCF